MKFKKTIKILLITLFLALPMKANAFGADIIVLAQMLSNAVQQLVQLRQILSTGGDSLSLMRDVNRGLRDGLTVIQILYPRFNPGIYGNLDRVDQVMGSLTNLYGTIPRTSEYNLQEAQDRSASESIAINGTLFRYADGVDEVSKRIIVHARSTNEQGATKLTAQSLAVLISVSTQILRTNSMMLKMMGENMALNNRREKLQSAQFKNQYDGLTNALRTLPKTTNLKPLDFP